MTLSKNYYPSKFQHKFFAAVFVLLCAFLGLIFWASPSVAKSIVFRAMDERAFEIISRIREGKDSDALIAAIKREKYQLFFRVTLFDHTGAYIYDTHSNHIKRLSMGEEKHLAAFDLKNDDAILALQEEQLATTGYSQLLNQMFAYSFRSFTAHNETYVLRVAFPLKYVESFGQSLEFSALLWTISLLLVFAILMGTLFLHFSKPIGTIISELRSCPHGTIEGRAKKTLEELSTRSDDCGKLALALCELSSKVDIMHRLHTDFVANASHELRTPLTVIGGFAETLASHSDLSSTQLSTIGEKIVANVERQRQMIENLLLLSHIENIPETACEEVDLADLLEKHKKEGVIDIHKEKETYIVFGNKGLLDLAFSNLISNAIKYCENQPKIDFFLEKTTSEVIVKVQDNGIGIEKALFDKVFDRFFRIPMTKKKEGSGLGLSIAAQIMKKHGGTIAIASSSKEGTIFCLRFPRLPPLSRQ